MRRRRRRRSGAGRAVGFILVAFGVAQCSSLPDYANPIEWYRNATGLSQHDDHGQQRNSENLESGGKEPYPNLGSMPPTPERAMSTIDRQNLARGLATDRAQAKDTDAQLRASEPARGPTPVGPPTAITRRAEAGKAHPAAEAEKGSHPSKSAAAAGTVQQHGSPGSEPAPRESALVSPSIRSVPSGDTPQEPPPPPNIPPPLAARRAEPSPATPSQAQNALSAPSPADATPPSSSPAAAVEPSSGARLSPPSEDAVPNAEQMATAEPRPAPPPPVIPPPETFASPSIPAAGEPQTPTAPAVPPGDASSPVIAAPRETPPPAMSASPGEGPKPDDAAQAPQPPTPPEQAAIGVAEPAASAGTPGAPPAAPTSQGEPGVALGAPPSTETAKPSSEQSATVEPAQSAPSPVPIVPPADSAGAAPAPPEQTAALPPAQTAALPPPSAGPVPSTSQPGAAAGEPRLGKATTISVQVAEIEFEGSSVALSVDDDRRLADTMKLYEKHGGTIRVVGYGRRGYGPDAAQQEFASFSKAIDRANVVAQALTKLGLPSNRIIVQAAPVGDGLGEDRAEILLEF